MHYSFSVLVAALFITVTMASPTQADIAIPVPVLGCEEGDVQLIDIPEPGHPGLVRRESVMCQESTAEGGGAAITDCPSKSYTRQPYKFAAPLMMSIDPNGAAGVIDPSYPIVGPLERTIRPAVGMTNPAILGAFVASGQSWDGWVNPTLFSGFAIGGSASNVGRLNGANQIGWLSLTPGVIGTTITWYYPATGLAVETDAGYSTAYPWSVDGRPGHMDVQNVATHELGHSLGLDHPASTTANSCLTMYASGDLGETKKRTLGDGDIHGIFAIYG